MDNRIILGSDAAGFPLKEIIKNDLISKGYHITDVGTLDPNKPIDYYQVGFTVAEAISEKRFERGLLFCGTGMGVTISANKYPNVYAAVCESPYTAKRCRVINNANILSMGNNIVTPPIAIQMVDAFLNTEFTEGLPEEKIDYLNFCLAQLKKKEEELFC